MKHWHCVTAVFALVLGLSSAARAQQQITLIAPAGAKPAFDILLVQFEAKTGTKVQAAIGAGLGSNKQTVAGGFDVSVTQPPLAKILKTGNVDAQSQTPLASIAMAMAVKTGAPQPDISTPAAVKHLLLSAKTLAYPDPADSSAGKNFEQTLAALGIADQLRSRIRLGKGGAGAMALVVSGQVDFGFTFLSQMQVPGIAVVGSLPQTISQPTQLIGFVSARTKNPAAARALLAYLASPAADAVYKAQGMVPLGHGKAP